MKGYAPARAESPGYCRCQRVAVHRDGQGPSDPPVAGQGVEASVQLDGEGTSVLGEDELGGPKSIFQPGLERPLGLVCSHHRGAARGVAVP